MGATVTARAHWKNGAAHTPATASASFVGAYPWTGANGAANADCYSGRYTVVTDALGASRVTVAGLSKKQALNRRLRLDVTESAAAHTAARSTGGAALGSDGTGTLEVKLSPNATYYVWLFCDGWCDRFTDTELSLGFSGSYGAAAAIEAGDGVFGQALPIALTGAAAGAAVTLTVSCAGRSETIAEASAASDFLWTPALETYAPLLPESAQAEALLTAETFYGGVSAGTRTRTVTLRFAPGTCAPLLESGWAAAEVLNEGAASGFTVYIQGYSRARVRFDAAKIAPRYGASVRDFAVTLAGVTAAAAPYDTPVLTGTEARLLCTVTDSRGQSASEILTLSVEPCAAPALAGVRVFRSDASGGADESGTYLAVGATAVYSSLAGENRAALTARVRPLSGAWGAAETLESGVLRTLGPCSPDTACEVRILLRDALGREAVYEQRLPTRRWAMKFRPDGQGVAFGKAAELDRALELPEDWTLRIGGADPLAALGGRLDTLETDAARREELAAYVPDAGLEARLQDAESVFLDVDGGGYAPTSLLSASNRILQSNTKNGWSSLVIGVTTAGTWAAGANKIATVLAPALAALGHTYVTGAARVGNAVGLLTLNTYGENAEISVTVGSKPAAGTRIEGSLAFPVT